VTGVQTCALPIFFSTLHTLDAVETINRVVAVFPPTEQKQIRLQLATTLKAIISQRLVKRADGPGRVPAIEVMVTTAYVRECIMVPDKTSQIRDLIAAGGSQYGMQTFDQSLFQLLKGGLISLETALENASNPDDFNLKLAGVSSTSDSARDQMAGL
jgi:twitching motility protein PilT